MYSKRGHARYSLPRVPLDAVIVFEVCDPSRDPDRTKNAHHEFQVRFVRMSFRGLGRDEKKPKQYFC